MMSGLSAKWNVRVVGCYLIRWWLPESKQTLRVWASTTLSGETVAPPSAQYANRVSHWFDMSQINKLLSIANGPRGAR